MMYPVEYVTTLLRPTTESRSNDISEYVSYFDRYTGPGVSAGVEISR